EAVTLSYEFLNLAAGRWARAFGYRSSRRRPARPASPASPASSARRPRAGSQVKVVRLANYVAPASGGLRTALRELGAGYLAAGHEPVLVIPGRGQAGGSPSRAW